MLARQISPPPLKLLITSARLPENARSRERDANDININDTSNCDKIRVKIRVYMKRAGMRMKCLKFSEVDSSPMREKNLLYFM